MADVRVKTQSGFWFFLVIFFLFAGGYGITMTNINAEENKNSEEGKKATFVMSDDVETHITVQSRGDFAFKIKSNPTTGYSWALQKPVDETLLKFKGIKIAEQEPQAEHPLLGAPTYEIFVFEALQPGSTVVHLQYRRPWEKDAPPIQTHKIYITID